MDLHQSKKPLEETSFAAREHVVQFYEKEVILVSAVSGYFEGAFRNGGAALFIGTSEHRVLIEGELTAQGYDIAALRKSGTYVALDAAETLSQFMVDGRPDEMLFKSTMGTLLEQICRNGQKVSAFGEMVALLWTAGNTDAAIRLEDLWNDLAETYSFALFCAYPLSSFSSKKTSAPFVHICRQHARVISEDDSDVQSSSTP